MIIIIGMLFLSILAPFIALYAASYIKKKKYQTHIKIQKWLFGVCVTGVLILEIKIRASGGSGSLVANSQYTDTLFFRFILIAHIIGAVLTYLLWASTIFWSSKKNRNKSSLPGQSSTMHKKLGYLTIGGLFYTAITALIVCSLAFFVST